MYFLLSLHSLKYLITRCLTGSYESLKDPNNVLLTKEIAEKYFGDWKTAMGKTIKLEVGGYIFEHGTEILKVSGILATIPVKY